LCGSFNDDIAKSTLGKLMKECLERLAKEIVDEPGRVEIEVDETDDRIIYTVRVAQNDVGKLIGKQGRTANALRIIVSAIAGKNHKRASVEIEGS
jgi:predicted RNA-binding protein YlqC (UPF0109 family)